MVKPLTLFDALQSQQHYFRLSNGLSWLIWDNESYEVYRAKGRGSKPKLLIRTTDENEAVTALLKY